MLIHMKMDVEVMEGKSVLVFLKPVRPSTNSRIHAWQEIKASAGATSNFEFDNIISCNITTSGGDEDESITSQTSNIKPGQLLLAKNNFCNLSPELTEAPTGMAKKRLTAEQFGIHNQTCPATDIDCNWLVSGSRVITLPLLDWGMTCSFQYEPKFYFMVAAPLEGGENYTVQAFTDMYSYEPSLLSSRLDIEVTKCRGRWKFDYTAYD